MLNNNGLYDPIERTYEMKPEEFTKYIEICNRQNTGGTTEAQMVDDIREDFYKSHPDVSESELDAIWKVVGPKVEANAGLAQFISDYEAAKSEYFFPWLVTVANSPSAALEMAYGAGYGLHGEWVRRTRESDPIETFVRNVPTFVYNRERQLFVADLVTTLQKKASRRAPSNIVDLGAGRLAWARWHGFKFDPGRQAIIAFDRDTSINVDWLFNRTPNELGLSYYVGDLSMAFTHPECKNADLIMLGGVVSYMPIDMFVNGIVMPSYGFLRHGGVFFFDLQLQCPQYEWTVKLFDWPEMKLAESPEAAIRTVEAVRHGLWQKGFKFGADYKVDTYNENPSAVMITFTKI